MSPEEKKRILSELGGLPEEVYNSLVLELITQTDQKVSEIKQALQDNDFDVIAKLAHSVKGAAGNLRIFAVHEAARDVEMEAKESRRGLLIEEKLAAIISCLAELRSCFL